MPPSRAVHCTYIGFHIVIAVACVCVCLCESTKRVAAIWITVERTRAPPPTPPCYLFHHIIYFFYHSVVFCFFHFVRSLVDGFGLARAGAAACRFNIMCAEKFGVKRNRGVERHIEWMEQKKNEGSAKLARFVQIRRAGCVMSFFGVGRRKWRRA